MPVALGVNGGVLGSNNLPSSGSAKGIWTPNEIARAVALGFWPVNYARSITETATGADVISTGANADPYFNLTTLLLSTTATNGQQNNTFQDSSTNNFTITRNGNTTQGTFSPFSQTGWGNYFDGTSDYLTVNDNAALELGSSNFCLEFMYYPTSSANTDFVTKRVNAASYGLIIVQTGLALNFWLSSSGSSWDLFSNAALGSVTLNAWNHLAIYRIGNAWYSSLNGTITTLSASLSGSVVNNAANWNIGGNNYASGSVIGYLSNFRLVIGSSVYTSTSAPIPTTPLTAVTNTQLLTCQSNRFVDNSTNNFSVTPTGNTTVVPFSPFNPTSAWSASTVGGSGYFDGTGDYLSIAANAQFLPGANVDFSFEAWVYLTATPSASAAQIVGLGEYGLNADWTLTVNSSLQPNFYINKPFTVTSSKAIALNSWNHIQATRSGTATNDVKLFLNGEQVGQGTETGTLDYNGNNLTLGGDANGDESVLTGYISGVRLINGTGYTSVTVPTAPPTAITNTVLLLNFTNAGIYDATAKNVLETVGNAQVSTAQSKWSPTSMYFDGTGDWLDSLASNQLFNLSSGNWTIEAWIYRNVSGAAHTILTLYNTAGSNSGLTFYVNASNQLVTDNGVTAALAAGTVASGQWVYVAIVRSGSTTTGYINGSSVGTTAQAPSASQYARVGALASGASVFNGYIQDLRITKGYARTITTPTAAFPTL